MKKPICIVMLLLTMIFIFSACKGSENNEKTTNVRIAYFPNITHTQALVIKNQGTLEKALGDDCKVTWKAFNAGPAEIEALFAGEIDLGYIGPVPAINAYVKSSGDLNIIAGATNGGAVLVTRKDLVLKDASELDGLKVAIPQLGNTQHLSLLNLLSENGLSTTSKGGTVEVVAAANADIKSLMDNKSIDAALVPEPWGSILLNTIGANLLLDYDDIWMEGNYSTAVVLASKDFITAHPDIVQSFLQVHKDATLYINDNMEETKEIVNSEIEKETSAAIETSVLDSAFDRLIISSDIPTESILAFAELNLAEGFIEELPDDALINNTFLGKTN